MSCACKPACGNPTECSDPPCGAREKIATSATECDALRDALATEAAASEQYATERDRLKADRDEWKRECAVARSDIDSLCRELAVICGGPGTPRDGESRVAYWLRRVGATLAEAERQHDVALARVVEIDTDNADLKAKLVVARAQVAEVEKELDRQGAPREWGSSCPQTRTPAERVRKMMREWREATMLDNQDSAAPEHLRQWLQDLGDDRERLHARVAEVEAKAAAMREALRTIANWPGGRWETDRLDILNTGLAALFSDSGRSLLDRHAAEVAKATEVLNVVRAFIAAHDRFETEGKYKVTYDSDFSLQLHEAEMRAIAAMRDAVFPARVAWLLHRADCDICKRPTDEHCDGGFSLWNAAVSETEAIRALLPGGGA